MLINLNTTFAGNKGAKSMGHRGNRKPENGDGRPEEGGKVIR